MLPGQGLAFPKLSR